jgi:Protein of unknown function, DUF481
MKLRLVLLCAILLAASPLSAREKTDVLVMKNGDHITCEIKALRSNTLYIKVAYILSTLSVDWNKVDHVESKQLFLVETQDGTVHTGALSTPETADGRPKQLDVLKVPEGKLTLERKQVVDIKQTSDNFWKRFNGEIGTGFTYSKGNEASQYNVNSDVSYPRDRWSAQVSYSSNLSASSGATTATRNEITFAAQRLLRWNNWYYIGLADFLQGSVQGIQLQNTFGGGIGRIFKNTGGTYFAVYSGFAWQQINYHQAVLTSPSQQVTSALVGANLKLFRFDRTSLTANAIFLPAVSEPGRMHFVANTAYYVKLWGQLNWNFTFYGDWDNRPPPGFSSSDYGTTSGLSLTFGNR